MPLQGLDHYSVRTAKLKETRDFYVDALGFVDGFRPPFAFPGHWLYLGDRPLVHLIGIDSNDRAGLVGYLGDADLSDLEGTGAIDHLAFRAADASGLIANLQARAIPYRERKVPDLDLFQVFLEDPNGVTVELNYVQADA